MTPKNAADDDPASTPPLHRALDQSERVKEKVEAAASELSDVNAALKVEVATGVPLVDVQDALGKSEAVEIKVHEAAEELVAVNDALNEEIAERDSLEHRALHDAVTGLPNVTLFGDRLDNALGQARRHFWRLAVLFLDLDGFKQVNDSHGHDVGDRVLKDVAKRLVDATRGGDSVGRRGGDEFLVLMLEVQDDASAITLAAKLCERISEPFDVDGISVTVGMSIGIAVYPDDATVATDLLKCADTAMYVAKKGRLGVARYQL